jgi:hypothetical protein
MCRVFENKSTIMLNRTLYLFAFLTSIIISLISYGYIYIKSKKLIKYWGSDFLPEIYQHEYSIDKFFIQLFFTSFFMILCSLILLVFNFKKKIIVYTIFIFSLLLSGFILNSLYFVQTDTNLSELGSVDISL